MSKGGILSPLLFNVYINRLIEDVQQMRQGCSLGYVKTNIIGYAEDILLTSPFGSGLQSLINRVCYFLDELSLSINPWSILSEDMIIY